MEEVKQINEHEFTNLLEAAINSGDSQNILWRIRKDLEGRLDLDPKEFFLDDPFSEGMFEAFIKQTIDTHGLDLTGDKAFAIAREWIRNSNKVPSSGFQN